MSQRKETVATAMVRQVGFRKAVKSLAFLAAWGIASDEVGHPLTIEEYGEWWGESRAKAFRDQQTFRAALPGVDHAELWERARELVSDRNRSRRGVGAAAIEAGSVPL